MEYIVPKNVEEIYSIVQNRTVYYLAGGTDIMVLKKDNTLYKDIPWIDISNLDELKSISVNNGCIYIGSLVTMAELAENTVIKEKACSLSEAAAGMGSPQIRELATIGGNLANSNPAGDTIPPLCALNAELVLQREMEKREVPAEEFCISPGKNILTPGEIITSIQIPVNENSNSGFFKIGPRNTLAISKASVSVWWCLDDAKVFKDIRIFMGAVGSKCLRAKKTEEFLIGNKLLTENIEKASEMIKYETCPIDDFRSTKEYRMKITGVLLKRILAGRK